ncbi:MAG: SurA N-terminal domain-containing protein [Alphaproteobacteria bacterium]|nr:SurA N-terminal domain-containing protein [Alphaproteobacteria bacterium]
MTLPSWIRPALIGGVFGAIIVAVVGFGWGGWLTAGKAEVAQINHAQMEVAAVLVPICVVQANADPMGAPKLQKLKDASSYQRAEMVMDAGWATMPGAESADRRIAAHCATELTS